MSVRFEWDGKPSQVDRTNLPLQTVETIKESRATREGVGRGRKAWKTMISPLRAVATDSMRQHFHQRTLSVCSPPVRVNSSRDDSPFPRILHRLLLAAERLTG